MLHLYTKFVGLTIRKISGILCVKITPSVTLTFDLETGARQTGHVTLGFHLGGHGTCE